MTITFQKPTDAIYPEVFCAVCLRGEVRRIAEAGVTDLEDTVPEQILRSQALVLSQHFLTELFPDLKARLHASFPRLALSCDAGHAPLQRGGRAFR